MPSEDSEDNLEEGEQLPGAPFRVRIRKLLAEFGFIDLLEFLNVIGTHLHVSMMDERKRPGRREKRPPPAECAVLALRVPCSTLGA
jgi:hypothetical protein